MSPRLHAGNLLGFRVYTCCLACKLQRLQGHTCRDQQECTHAAPDGAVLLVLRVWQQGVATLLQAPHVPSRPALQA